VLIADVPAYAADLAGDGSRSEMLTPVSSVAVLGRYAAAVSRRSASSAKSVSVILRLRDEALGSFVASNPMRDAAGSLAGEPLALDSALAIAHRDRLDARLSVLEAALLAAVPRARVTYRYVAAVAGLAAIVPEGSEGVLSALPGVDAILADELLEPMTDTSVALIGAPAAWAAPGGNVDGVGEGDGVVIAVLDTGIWPEHPCWSDPDPEGRPYPRPAKAHLCEFGGPHDDASFACNNKLIGAARFLSTHDAMIPPTDGEFLSARDNEGHGTHTAATAACNRGVRASIFGLDRGVISGVAPRAQVMAYKVCGSQGCFASDTVAAVDRAILDGVDVINFSVGGGGDPYTSASELAFLDAYNAGIFVSASAGNGGPLMGSVLHRGPWVTSVAASRNARRFVSGLGLRSAGAPDLFLEGGGLSDGIQGDGVPVEVAGGDGLCDAGMPAVTPGAIVVCDRGGSTRPAKSFHAAEAGAGGMILRNLFSQGVATDNHYLPTVHLEAEAGDRVLAYLLQHENVTGTITSASAQPDRADAVAIFSARGGPAQDLGVGKPDLTAPGVQILSANTAAPYPEGEYGPVGELFQVIQGTSMSSPHVAGAAALLKGLHPAWGPGRIKSALMTTSKVRGLVLEDEATAADAYACGSGRINLRRAWDPLLTISASGSEFVEHAADLWNSNHPSAHLPSMPGRITLHRTVRSESAEDEMWRTRALAPAGVHASVRPRRLLVPAGETADLRVKIDASDLDVGHDAIVEVRLNQGERIVRMPISLVRREPIVTIDKSCTPEDVAVGQIASCEITVANRSYDTVQVAIKERSSKRVRFIEADGDDDGRQALEAMPRGGLVRRLVLAGGRPPGIALTEGGAPFGYVPLSGFDQIEPLARLGDDDIVDVSIPPVTFAGRRFHRIGVASNGFIVLGGGKASQAAVRNQSLPDPASPNDVLAPAWSDYDPSLGGEIRVGTLTNGTGFWTVVDWQDVPNADGSGTNSFQIWLGNNADEDVSFAYGSMTGGSGGRMTIGAENVDGSSGQTVFYDGNGSAPRADLAVDVTATPPSPGETRRLHFDLHAEDTGAWRTCTSVRSSVFQGANVACVRGAAQ